MKVLFSLLIAAVITGCSSTPNVQQQDNYYYGSGAAYLHSGPRVLPASEVNNLTLIYNKNPGQQAQPQAQNNFRVYRPPQAMPPYQGRNHFHHDHRPHHVHGQYNRPYGNEGRPYRPDVRNVQDNRGPGMNYQRPQVNQYQQPPSPRSYQYKPRQTQ